MDPGDQRPDPRHPDQPLDLGQAQLAVRELLDAGVEAIAVCLVNSYLNPVHERALGELIRRIAPGMVVCLSCDIHPEIREYERTSTTAVNACLIPVFNRYMDRLEASLARHSRRFLIMQSNGGIMSAQAARRKPAYIIESGPAAGVLAAARVAQESGLDQALSFDMGGTTAKICLIRNQTPKTARVFEVARSYRFKKGSGFPVSVPSVDLVDVDDVAGDNAAKYSEEASPVTLRAR